MRMAAERKLGVGVGQDVGLPVRRVMLQHQYETASAVNPPEGLPNVSAVRTSDVLALIFHAGNDEGVAAAADDAVLVEQKRPAQTALFLYHLAAEPAARGIVHVEVKGVVVVAEDGVYPVMGMQTAEDIPLGGNLRRADVLQVAGKGNHVGVLGVDAVDGINEDMRPRP